MTAKKSTRESEYIEKYCRNCQEFNSDDYNDYCGLAMEKWNGKRGFGVKIRGREKTILTFDPYKLVDEPYTSDFEYAMFVEGPLNPGGPTKTWRFIDCNYYPETKQNEKTEHTL
jgi:hypothetical protein